MVQPVARDLKVRQDHKVLLVQTAKSQGRKVHKDRKARKDQREAHPGFTVWVYASLLSTPDKVFGAEGMLICIPEKFLEVRRFTTTLPMLESTPRSPMAETTPLCPEVGAGTDHICGM
jgi:hypothetical protein